MGAGGAVGARMGAGGVGGARMGGRWSGESEDGGRWGGRWEDAAAPLAVPHVVLIHRLSNTQVGSLREHHDDVLDLA